MSSHEVDLPAPYFARLSLALPLTRSVLVEVPSAVESNLLFVHQAQLPPLLYHPQQPVPDAFAAAASGSGP